MQPRHSWAATSSHDLRRKATPAHLPLPNAIVFLLPGEQLVALNAQLGTPLAAVQRLAAAWEQLQRDVQRAGVGSASRLPGALLAADTAAAALAQLGLLPLADAGAGAGLLVLGLYAVQVVLAAAAGIATAAAELSQLRSPAQAWDWLARHAAAHASSPTALQHLAGWTAEHRSLASWVLAGAATVQLVPGVALPLVASGWQDRSWLARLPVGCCLVLAAPAAKGSQLPALDTTAVVAAAAAAGCQLVLGPLEVREKLSSRSGCQLLALQLRVGSLTDLLQHLASASSAACLMVDVTSWLQT